MIAPCEFEKASRSQKLPARIHRSPDRNPAVRKAEFTVVNPRLDNRHLIPA